jgi:hypothetical protein
VALLVAVVLVVLAVRGVARIPRAVARGRHPIGW